LYISVLTKIDQKIRQNLLSDNIHPQLHESQYPTVLICGGHPNAISSLISARHTLDDQWLDGFAGLGLNHQYVALQVAPALSELAHHGYAKILSHMTDRTLAS